MSTQLDLFDAATSRSPVLPEGFRYQAELITASDEAALLAHVRALPFHAFEFHGYTGKRRVVSFGWQYDFASEDLRRASDMPAFLLALRQVAAGFIGLAPEVLRQALVTEYAPGAGIGWHRDKPVFGQVVGISLLSPCVFRLRRPMGHGWKRLNLVAEPRSAYALSGHVRTVWEHSIPPVDALRYSITFRSLHEA